MHVCVLGAGIVGLATAYVLARDGHQVTVVDRAHAAAGASGGNGGQLSYSYVQPLAGPAIWAQLPSLLLSPSSPLKIRPQLDTRQWKWVFRFLMACNAATSQATTARLLLLAAASRAGFEAMLARERLDCDFSAAGKLVIFSTEEDFAAARRQLELQRSLGGAPQQAMSRDEALALEPALADTRQAISGAIYTSSECAADCHKVCLGLEGVLRASGVAFHFGRTVTGLDRRGRKARAVRTDQGDIAADAFVVAMGAASARLAQCAGVDLPLYPLKGYSITLDLEATGLSPRVNVTDSARKVVFARIGNRLRVAGMAELVGDDTSIPAERIETLRAAAASLFPGCVSAAQVMPWAGMRPATPTGEPITGRHRHGPDNLIFNSGHGALGFTLAFGSARQVSALLSAPAVPYA